MSSNTGAGVGDRVRVRDTDSEDWKLGTVMEMNSNGRPKVQVDGTARPFAWAQVEPAAESELSPLLSANEFEGKNEKGVNAKPGKSEAEARSFYWNMYGKLVLLQAPVLAWGTYLGTKYLVPGLSDVYQKKFKFIHDNQLGPVFLGWFIIYLTRIYMSINSNGARAPAGVDRPDQHVYKLMNEKYSDHPYVLMASTGDAGRFNRAQRAAYNMDESLPIYLSGTALAGSVFGWVIIPICLLAAYGRVKFSNLYKEDKEKRGAGFLPAVVAEHLTAGLVGVCAIKGIFGPLITV